VPGDSPGRSPPPPACGPRPNQAIHPACLPALGQPHGLAHSSPNQDGDEVCFAQDDVSSARCLTAAPRLPHPDHRVSLRGPAVVPSFWPRPGPMNVANDSLTGVPTRPASWGSLTSAPPGPLPLTASRNRFFAAFTSRSMTRPHLSHVKPRSVRDSLAFTIPQAEHVLELGKTRSATMSWPPCQQVL
jgi:hypothetical protein